MTANEAWNLESFLNSLIVELDRARETLAVKAINRPLTYAVKDVSLQMQLFPRFDGRSVQFVTAQPGQTGASTISVQLGSITDQQIRKTTKQPISKDDLSIEVIDDIDDDTKHELRTIGVTSVSDLAEIERENVDLEKASNRRVDFSKLAGLLRKARRGIRPPAVHRASLAYEGDKRSLRIDGKNLALDHSFEPVAVFNGALAEVAEASDKLLSIDLSRRELGPGKNELVIAVDPFTVFRLHVTDPRGGQ